MTVVTRFAPSPTGPLHIGNVRTAIFNWLFAKTQNGKFYLRVEDTDLKRSKKEYEDRILSDMEYMGLSYDGDIIYQSKNINRHKEVAKKLIESGNAYYCKCTKEEIDKKRQEAIKNGKPPKYDGSCRDLGLQPDNNTKYTVRLKLPQDGEVKIDDKVMGQIKIENKQLEDLIILRDDGSPTYMLSVVVDDHDMGVTHIIRGDDHMTNTFKQYHIYNFMGFDIPTFVHIPLIHNQGGGKMSKRDSAMGIFEYRQMGYLSDALFNYLLRLGFSHGDEEIISRENAIKWFNLKSINKSPAKFDIDKLSHLNKHYIREENPDNIFDLLNKVEENKIDEKYRGQIINLIPEFTKRATTILDIVDLAKFLYDDIKISADDLKIVDAKLSYGIIDKLNKIKNWDHNGVKDAIMEYANESDVKMGYLAKSLRIILTGKQISIGIFDIVYSLGREIVIDRIRKISL